MRAIMVPSSAQAHLMHATVDTQGQHMALRVMSTNEQERAHVGELVCVNQGSFGEAPTTEAEPHGIPLAVVILEDSQTRLCLATATLAG